jgi:hypothetical protein
MSLRQVRNRDRPPDPSQHLREPPSTPGAVTGRDAGTVGPGEHLLEKGGGGEQQQAADHQRVAPPSPRPPSASVPPRPPRHPCRSSPTESGVQWRGSRRWPRSGEPGRVQPCRRAGCRRSPGPRREQLRRQEVGDPPGGRHRPVRAPPPFQPGDVDEVRVAGADGATRPPSHGVTATRASAPTNRRSAPSAGGVAPGGAQSEAATALPSRAPPHSARPADPDDLHPRSLTGCGL